MASSAFDTLEATRALEAAGMERRQAEATAGQLRAAAGADRDELATKAEIARVETKIENAVNRMMIAQLAIAGLLFAALERF